MVSQAFAAVQRNKGALFLYMAVSMGLLAIQLGGDSLLTDDLRTEISPAYVNAYEFGIDLLIALAYAIAQCVAFARIARDMDRPLWKVDTALESLRRFFRLWFILMLINIALARLTERSVEFGNEAIEALFGFCWILTVVVIIPFGACVMFHGRAGTEEVRLAADTLVHQFPRTLIVLFMAFTVLCILMAIRMAGILPEWALPVLGAIDGYGDCLIFSAAWLICMYNRDDDMGDPDIDF